MFKRLCVQIPAPDTGWTFFTLNCNFCLKRPNINEKEAGNGRFKQTMKNSRKVVVVKWSGYSPSTLMI